MGWWDDVKSEVESLVQGAFEACSVSAEGVRGQATGTSLENWRALNVGLAAACAGGALIPGPGSLAALAVEIPALLNIFSRAALGVGWIKRGSAVDADYVNILAVWSGQLTLDNVLFKTLSVQGTVAAASTAATVAGTAMIKSVAGAAAAKAAAANVNAMYASAIASVLAATAARKATTYGAAQLAARKFTAKLLARLPARLVPFIGFGVAAALNGYFVNGIIDAAESYYDFMGKLPRLET